MRRFFYLFFFVLLTGFSFQSQITEVEEYNLKAAFIYNFTKYINVDNYTRGNEFIIGILGDSPIYGPLEEIARTKTVNNKKIIILRFNNPQEISFTNILFVSQLNPYSLNSFLPKVAAKGTLVVSEEEGMAAKGIAINFIIDGSKLKFEANLKALSSAGLKASSELLQHAIIINQ